MRAATVRSASAPEDRPSVALLVTDDALRAILQDIVAEVGFRILETPPVAAPDVVEKDAPDAIIVHSRLQDRQRIIGLARIACLVVLKSSFVSVSAEELGAFCLIETPFELDELEAQLHRCLGELRRQFSQAAD